MQLKRTTVEANPSGRLENIVAQELIARGYSVKVGVLRDAEIDFVAERDGNRLYIQVAYKIDSDETLERELSAFNRINDHYQKILLTTDSQDFSQNGIKHFNVVPWLLGNR